MKAYFLQRVLAYIIDVFIISALFMIMQIVIPVGSNYDRLASESKVINDKAINGEYNSVLEYLEDVGENNYGLLKASYMHNVVEVLLYLSYFVYYQTAKKGQTIGKKIMKIGIKKKDGSDLSYNDSLKRTLVLHGLFASIILLIAVLVFNSKQYMPVAIGVDFLSVTIMIVTVIMVIFRKDGRGLHDMFAGTEVLLAESDALPEVINIKEMVEATVIDGSLMPDIDEEEGSRENEGTSRARSSKKRKSKGNK